MARILQRDAREELNRRRREAARQHLLDFTTYTFPQYKPDPAHRLIAAKLDEVVADKCQRLMIFAPPQSGKSELVSVRLPAFWLGKRPNDPVIMCTYGASLAHNKSRLARAAVESDEYAELFPTITTDPASRAVDHWELAHPHRGGLLATGVGGPVTGHGGMCFPAGTMVTTDRGRLDIAELAGTTGWPGVLTYDHDRARLGWGRVLGVHSQMDEELVEIVTEDGPSITATPTHPVYCKERGYVEAQDLATNDWLYSGGAFYLQMKRVSEVRRLQPGRIPVYDLRVAGTHNYFANSILVHNCGIIDDPFENWEQAYSPTIRRKVWEWWRGTFRTRIWEHGTIILILTRWHEDDLAGRILMDQGDEWEVMRLPAVGETQEDRDQRNEKLGLAKGLPDPLDREPGEALTPTRFSIGALANIKLDVGTLVWESQYMGSPTMPEGNRFKREWFRIVDQAPANMDTAWYWDKAGTAEDEGEGAYTAGVKVGGPDVDGLYYVIDVKRGRWSALQRERVIRQTAELEATLEWNDDHTAFTIRHPGPPIHYEQEPGSGGKESAESTLRSLAGFQAYADRVTGDKDVRLEPFAVQMEAGNVRLVRGPWNGQFIEELCAVPFGKYRDMADATAGGFNKLAGAVSAKFIQMEHWDACKGALPALGASEPLVLAMYSVKGDDPTIDSTFAVIGVTRHPERTDDVAVRYAGIWQPTEGQQINYDEVENAVRGLCQTYAVAEVAYLKAQLHDMANRLRREGLARFREFSSESERIRADKRLQDLVVGRRITHDGNPLLREHMDAADVEKRGTDGIRIVPRSPALRAGAAVALAMACDRSLYYNLG